MKIRFSDAHLFLSFLGEIYESSIKESKKMEGNCYRIHTISTMTNIGIIFTLGQFWPSGIVVACVCVCVCLSVCQSLACPRDNLGPVQARITKFGPKMQKTLVKVPIVLEGQLTMTFKVKFNLKVQIYPILSLSAP